MVATVGAIRSPTSDRESRDLLRALVASAQGSSLTSDQHYTIDEVWRELPVPRPLRVLGALYELVEPHLASATTGPRRSLALVLYRFVHGDLAGLFDGEGQPMRFSGSLVVLDLSAQWSANSFSVAALSAVAAAQQVVAGGRGLGLSRPRRGVGAAGRPHALRWLQGSWKLARARGLSHVLVLHRWTDVAAVGDAGSAERESAQGLLRECETAWLFRQPPDEAREMAVALGLHHARSGTCCALPKGGALVRYGAHRSVVRVEPDARDRAFIDTDGAMSDRRRVTSDRPVARPSDLARAFPTVRKFVLAAAQLPAHRRTDPGRQDVVAGGSVDPALDGRPRW